MSSKLNGSTGTFVDDPLSCGDKLFCSFTEETQDKFKFRGRKVDGTVFTAVRIRSTDFGLELIKDSYIKRLRTLPMDATFKEFTSMRHLLAWLTQTRPDIYCAVNMSAQIKEEKFSMDTLKTLNEVVKHIQKTQSISFKNFRLHKDSPRQKVYSDSSFANNMDNISQLGYIVLVIDKTGKM